MMALNGIVGKADQMMDHIDALGRPDDVPALRHRLGLGGQHAVPVDQAGRQPLRRHAQRHGPALAQGHQGQGRGPQPVPPRHRRRADRARSGRAFPSPRRVNGVEQRPMDGVSMLYSHRRRQGRGPPHDAVLRDVRQPRHLPRRLGRLHAPLDPLADGAAAAAEGRRGSSTTSTRTSARRTTSPRRIPEKLKELQAVFMKEAERNHVLPIDDRRSERFNPAIAGRPDLLGGRKTLTVYPGMTGMMENAFINVKGVHHTDHRRGRAAGRQDERRHHRAGRLLRRLDALHEGRQASHHEYNFFGARAHQHRRRQRRSPPASTRSATSSSPTRPSPAPAASRSSASTAQKVAEGQIPKTQPFAFSADEGADVGLDAETNVSADYKQSAKLHRQDRQGDGRAALARRGTKKRPLPQGSGRFRFTGSPGLTWRRSL